MRWPPTLKSPASVSGLKPQDHPAQYDLIFIERGDQPLHGRCIHGLLKSGDLGSTHIRFPALQLNQPHIERVSVLPPKPKHNCVDDPSSRRARRALKERDLPLVLFAVDR